MLSRDKVYRLCVKNNWFTCGTPQQYDKMFDMIDEGYGVEKVAVAIYICSPRAKMVDIMRQLYDSMAPEYLGEE